MRQTPLQLHLYSHHSLTIVKEKVVWQVSLRCDTTPAFQSLNDFDLKCRLRNHTSDHAEREPSRPVNGFQNDFCLSVQLNFQRMDGKFFSQVPQNFLPLCRATEA